CGAGPSNNDRGRRGGNRPPPVVGAGPGVGAGAGAGVSAANKSTTVAGAGSAAPKSPRPFTPPIPRMPAVVPGVTAPVLGGVLPVTGGSPLDVLAGDKVVIDVGAIAREMTKKLAPEGLEKMTPEERQRVNR